MNLISFLEIVLQEDIRLFIVTGLLGLNMKTPRQQEWREFSWQSTVYIAKSSLETRLDHGFPIEYMYFQ